MNNTVIILFSVFTYPPELWEKGVDKSTSSAINRGMVHLTVGFATVFVRDICDAIPITLLIGSIRGFLHTYTEVIKG